MKKNLDIYKLASLVITNIFYQSLGPSLYRSSLCLILFIYFSKSGEALQTPPPSPSPCAGPVKLVYNKKAFLSINLKFTFMSCLFNRKMFHLMSLS